MGVQQGSPLSLLFLIPAAHVFSGQPQQLLPAGMPASPNRSLSETSPEGEEKPGIQLGAQKGDVSLVSRPQVISNFGKSFSFS